MIDWFVKVIASKNQSNSDRLKIAFSNSLVSAFRITVYLFLILNLF
ncbi:MAG: hypothetical protein WCP16_25935 [Pseudanabaena sp. ELA645]